MSFTRNVMMLVARISPRTMLIIIAAGAGVTSYLYSTHMSANDIAVKNKIDEMNRLRDADRAQTQILMAARDIPEGSVISPQDVVLQFIEKGKVPQGAVMDSGYALGLKAKFTITAGQPILTYAVGTQRPQTGFQAKIRDGYRAVTFAVDTTTGVAGFVGPDSHVDIFAQVGSGAEVKSCAILGDVQVVAAGTEYKRVPGEAEARPVNCVTVAVRPVDATKLLNAMAAGRIYLTLRNDGDHTPLAISDLSELFPKKAVVAEQPSIPTLDFKAPPLPPVRDQELSVSLPVAPSPHAVEQWEGSKRDEQVVAPN